ncbi:MAG: hypothetical protein AAGF10_06965, partial [Verrucomicrobiota bacterium]
MQYDLFMLRLPLTTLLCCCFIFTGLWAESTSNDQAGYALLYTVVSQNKDVDDLLIIKSPGKDIETWVKEVAKLCGEVNDQLEAWKKDGSITNLNDTYLPEAEVKARGIDTSKTSSELLWGGGVNLRVGLMVSELSAVGYCRDLCDAIAKLP